MISIQEIKQFMKKNNITYQELSDKSGIPLNTLKNIFAGYTKHPRIDTMQAICKTLGLENEKAPTDETEGAQEWMQLYYVLTDENRDLLVKLVTAFKDMPPERRRFVLDAIKIATQK